MIGPFFSRLVGVAVLSAALLGCNEGKQDPEEAFRRFAADVHARRGEPAWAALTDSSKAEIERRHDAFAGAAGKGKATPAAMLFDELGLLLLNPPESVVIVSPPGREVVLRVTVKDGKSADVRMIREGQRWKVDLMGSLKKAAPLDQGLQGPSETATATVP